MSYIDEFDLQLLDAEWAGFNLDLLQTSDTFNRGIVRFQYPNVDGARLRDMGAEPRETSCDIVFIPPMVIDRLQEFLAIVSEGKAYRFVHPIFGSYMARCESVSVAASGGDRDYVVVSATFVEEISDVTFEDAYTELSSRAEVSSAVADLVDLLDGENLSSDVGAQADAMADEWEALDTIDPRKINLELNEINNAIATAIDDLDLVSDIDKYPILLSMERIADNMRTLAARLLASAPKHTTHTVVQPLPLLAIAQAIYGGADAMDMFADIMDRNDIDNPAMVPGGSVLTVQVPS